MKTKLFRVLVAGGGLLLATSPVLAHHWFPRTSDQPVSMTGTVTRVVWINPHARFYIDVKDEKGEVKGWEIEIASPAALVRRGWSRDTLKIGEQVVVDAYLLKGEPNVEGANLAEARFVQFPDGRQLFAGSHGGDG